jgi:hypothetical protein
MRQIARLIGMAFFLWSGTSAASATTGTGSPPPPPSATVRAWQTGLLRPDRLEHASLAFSLGLGAGILSRAPGAAAASALALGLAKEVRDRRHGGFDPLDLAADAIGAGLAALATNAVGR